MKISVPLMLLFLCLQAQIGGCRKMNPAELFADSHTASYMNWIDAEKVALALQRSADRQSVKWENPITQYQYSAFVFKSREKAGLLEREMTLLAVSPESQGESLDLIGRSNGKGLWHIFAVQHASPVGRVSRESLPTEDLPTGRSRPFRGYPVISED